MGAFLITYPGDEIRSILIIFVLIRVTTIPAALLIGFWFLTQVWNAGSVATVQTGGVAYLAHIGGAMLRSRLPHVSFEEPPQAYRLVFSYTKSPTLQSRTSALKERAARSKPRATSAAGTVGRSSRIIPVPLVETLEAKSKSGAVAEGTGMGVVADCVDVRLFAAELPRPPNLGGAFSHDPRRAEIRTRRDTAKSLARSALPTCWAILSGVRCSTGLACGAV